MTESAIPEALRIVGIIVASALAAGAVLAPSPRARAAAISSAR